MYVISSKIVVALYISSHIGYDDFSIHSLYIRNSYEQQIIFIYQIKKKNSDPFLKCGKVFLFLLEDDDGMLKSYRPM